MYLCGKNTHRIRWFSKISHRLNKAILQKMVSFLKIGSKMAAKIPHRPKHKKINTDMYKRFVSKIMECGMLLENNIHFIKFRDFYNFVIISC